MRTDRLTPADPTLPPRPVYVDRLPPCNCACPAGENIQEWLYLAQASTAS
jgi:formate dehydrogenase beta subunit